MTKFYLNLLNLVRCEEGQDLAEYALLLGFVALAVLAIAIALGNKISTIFSLAVDLIGSR